MTFSSPALAGAEWVTTGSPVGDYFSGLLVTRADGSVFLIGRPDVSGTPAVVEQYHPDTGAWAVDGTLQSLAEPATVTALPSGLLLITGRGPAVELYDPVTGAATVTGSLNVARIDHRATLLPSGTVLVSGGADADGDLVPFAELYDPATGTWSITGTLNNPRTRHAAVRLPNGDVLVAGGGGPNGTLGRACCARISYGCSTASSRRRSSRRAFPGSARDDDVIADRPA